jgi:anaerobic ribonucleoside-triphosphate reductase activating protein
VRQAGWEVPIANVLERLLRIEITLDGITLTGGDPADQSEAIVRLLRGLRRERPDWNVMLYTGWTIEELRLGTKAHRALLNHVDVLVDGPYIREIAPTHPLAGSGNQRVLALSRRGELMIAAMTSSPGPSFNLAMAPDGASRLVGVSNPMERAAVHSQWGLVSLQHGTVH